MPAMRATSRRRCWSRRRRPISLCSTTRRARRRPAKATIRCCRSARIISTPASIRKYRSGATGRRRTTAPTLELGLDAYYKIAKDLIDNGQFGQALVLSAFNYAKGINEGIEFSANTTAAISRPMPISPSAQQRATNVVSNQYLFDNTTPLADLGGLTEFQYIATHWIYTDHTQIVTGSAGALYQFCGRPATAARFRQRRREVVDVNSWCGTRLSADMIYGRGCAPATPISAPNRPTRSSMPASSHEFCLPDAKPVTVRFDVVNLFDTSTRSATAAASACSRRNTARAAAITPACRRNSEPRAGCNNITVTPLQKPAAARGECKDFVTHPAAASVAGKLQVRPKSCPRA